MLQHRSMQSSKQVPLQQGNFTRTMLKSSRLHSCPVRSQQRLPFPFYPVTFFTSRQVSELAIVHSADKPGVLFFRVAEESLVLLETSSASFG